MKTEWLVLLVLTLMLATQELDAVDYEKLEAIQSQFQIGCSDSGTWAECRSHVDSMRLEFEDSDSQAQITITQLLQSISGRFPAALDYAYEILSELLATDPGNTAYLDQRAWIRFAKEPLAGILEAHEYSRVGNLSMLLNAYEKSNRLSNDIVKGAMAGALECATDGELFIEEVMAKINFALDMIKEYGNDTDQVELVSALKEEIDLEIWRSNELQSRLNKVEYTERELVSTLYLFCQQSFLILDEGEFCSIATDNLSAKIPAKGIESPNRIELLRMLSLELERKKPTKAGNASTQLGEIAESR